MSEPGKLPLQKQSSLSHIEQSIKIIPCPPQQAPVTIYPGPKAGNQNLSKADLEIADRLEKLRNRSIEELPTEEEMASRLAHLKGLPADHYRKTSYLAYQPPDLRTQGEKSESLLKQAMEEVALDSRIVKPEDEIQARLSRLNESKRSSELGDVLRIGQTGSQIQDCEKDEMGELMQEVEREMNEAKASLKSLEKDKALYAEVKKKTSLRKKSSQKVKREGSTSSDELFSDDDDRRPPRCDAGDDKGGNSQKEKEEIDRIVNLYTQKARQKKEKRKALKGKEGKAQSDSDDSELSDSDIKSSTSESERMSDSD